MAKPEGEIAPVSVMCPAPLARTLCSVVLLESRDLTGAIFPRSAGVARNMGATRSFESALASSVRGSTTSTGPGSTSAMKPMKLRSTSVLRIWAPDSTTTWRQGWLGLSTSIGSRW